MSPDPTNYIKRLEAQVMEQGDEIKRLQALLLHHGIEPSPCPPINQEVTC